MALAERGYGIAVHFNRSKAEAEQTVAELKQGGTDALAVQADLTDEAAARAMVDQTLAHFGQLDVLVNCAAVWKSKRLEDVTAADVRMHFETNALGTFLASQQAGLAMVRQPEGGLIVMLGDWAEARPYLNYAAYFPSKGAVSTMTRVLAVELASRNPRIRVNCIMPGPVMIPRDIPAAEREEAINATLVKHEGSAKNIAEAVLSFIDNDFITGVCLPVDGGRTIYAG
jgi:pteridine reductase